MIYDVHVGRANRSSGSPIYVADGSVVGILVKDGKEEATGITIARPVSLVREMLAPQPIK